MPEQCPLLDDCDAATGETECAHFVNRSGVDWCDYFEFSPAKDPVSPGQVVDVDIFDADDRGNGLGRTSDGFVVRVDGGIPGKSAKAKIKTVYDNSAKAELVEFTGDYYPESDDEDEEDEESPRSGSRDNWYGQ